MRRPLFKPNCEACTLERGEMHLCAAYANDPAQCSRYLSEVKGVNDGGDQADADGGEAL